jgi:hypothetical protein
MTEGRKGAYWFTSVNDNLEPTNGLPGTNLGSGGVHRVRNENRTATDRRLVQRGNCYWGKNKRQIAVGARERALQEELWRHVILIKLVLIVVILLFLVVIKAWLSQMFVQEVVCLANLLELGSCIRIIRILVRMSPESSLDSR